MIYSSFSIVLISLLKFLVNCDDTVLNDSIIVNAINRYRDELICTKSILNMEYISSDQILIDQAKYLLKNDGNPNATCLVVKPKSCQYEYNSSINFESNVQWFIKRCIFKSQTNSNLSWVWNPKLTTIGCAYSSSGKPFVLCVLNKSTNTMNLEPKIREMDNSSEYLNKLKQNVTIFIKPCGTLQSRPRVVRCYITNSARKEIITAVNNIRKNWAERNCYALSPIDWDFSLEMTAIEISNYTLSSISKECFYTTTFLNGIGVYEFEVGEFFDVSRNLDKTISELIRKVTESNQSTIITSWMYNIHFNAIGCTFFRKADQGKLICVFNNRNECLNHDYPVLCSPSIMKTKPFCYNLPWFFGFNAYLVFGVTAIIIFNIIILIPIIKRCQQKKNQEIITRPYSDPVYAEVWRDPTI